MSTSIHNAALNAEPTSSQEAPEPDEPSRSSADVVEADGRWQAIEGISELLSKAALAAIASVRADSGPVSVSIALANDDEVRVLNRTYRGLDKPTNVLSFPPPPAHSTPFHGDAGEPEFLGDIVLAYETVEREAKAEAKTFANHAVHLTVHGTLHLLGYDHEEDSAASEMERREADILAALGVPDPYRDDEDEPGVSAMAAI